MAEKDDNFLKENNASHLWHLMGAPGDSLANAPTIIKGADGVHITDVDDNRVLDAVGGLWCENLGYSNDVVKEAIAKQLYDLPYYSAFAGTSNPTAIEASYAVREFFEPDGMVRVFFTSGGPDSVETCLRLSRQYHRLRGEPTRTKFLSLKRAITEPILAARRLMATTDSGSVMSRYCRAVIPFPALTPIAIRSMKPTRISWPKTSRRRWRTRSHSKARIPSRPLSWSQSKAREE